MHTVVSELIDHYHSRRSYTDLYETYTSTVQAGPDPRSCWPEAPHILGGHGLRTDRHHMQNMGLKGATFRQARILGASPSGLRRGASCGARVVGVAVSIGGLHSAARLRALEEEPHRKLHQVEDAEPAWPRQELRMGMRMHGGAGGGCVVCTPKSRHGIRNGHGIAMKTRATSPALRSRGCHPPSEHSGRPWSSTHAFSTSRMRAKDARRRARDARARSWRGYRLWNRGQSGHCPILHPYGCEVCVMAYMRVYQRGPRRSRPTSLTRSSRPACHLRTSRLCRRFARASQLPLDRPSRANGALTPSGAPCWRLRRKGTASALKRP